MKLKYNLLLGNMDGKIKVKYYILFNIYFF